MWLRTIRQRFDSSTRLCCQTVVFARVRRGLSSSLKLAPKNWCLTNISLCVIMSTLRVRLTVGLWTLNPPVEVRPLPPQPMVILKKEYKHKYKPPKLTYCSRCGTTIHRLRFNREDGWTYYACDICEFWIAEEVNMLY